MPKKNTRNTKGRIVAAAWKLFYEQGYEETTVEDIIFESETSGGLGSLLQQYAAERDSKTPVHVLALPDRWIYHGKRRELLRRMDLDAAGLRKAVRELLGR